MSNLDNVMNSVAITPFYSTYHPDEDDNDLQSHTYRLDDVDIIFDIDLYLQLNGQKISSASLHVNDKMYPIHYTKETNGLVHLWDGTPLFKCLACYTDITLKVVLDDSDVEDDVDVEDDDVEDENKGPNLYLKYINMRPDKKEQLLSHYFSHFNTQTYQGDWRAYYKPIRQLLIYRNGIVGDAGYDGVIFADHWFRK